jgi:hypothetical protein
MTAFVEYAKRKIKVLRRPSLRSCSGFGGFPYLRLEMRAFNETNGMLIVRYRLYEWRSSFTIGVSKR